ncbi:DUF6301 family protein [Nocardia sp. NPDC058058]|uniref:DUF6301 family protein n=1 Tax=Nocardia sp. NPDC058058 TaxID=3346317 RepID=UPI0036DD274F
MHVDIDGAVRIARVAADFGWTWTLADLQPFCTKTGWRITKFRELGAELTTNFAVNRQDASASLPEGIRRWRRDRSDMDQLSIFVSDVSDEADVITQIDSALMTMIEQFSQELGPSAPSEDDSHPTGRWDLPDVVIRLNGSYPSNRTPWLGSLRLELVSPAIQKLRDNADEMLEQQLRAEGRWVEEIDPPTDWPEFTARLAPALGDLPIDSVVSFRATGNRYVQLGRNSKLGHSSVEVWCEVVSNEFLEIDHRMSAADEATMVTRGWEAPTVEGSANWYREIPSPPSELERIQLAEEITAALSTTLHIGTPAQLTVEAWAGAPTNPFDVSALGLDPYLKK